MTDDLMKIKKETLSECIKAEEPWELLQAKVAEGPSVLKKKGMYYLIYSANHYQNKGYGVGYATSKSPMGPWTKYDKNPLLQGDESTVLDMVLLFNAKTAVGNIFFTLIGIKRKYTRVLHTLKTLPYLNKVSFL